MKKLLVLALVALFVLSFTATVMAAPVSVTGDARLRSITEDNSTTETTTNKLRLRLYFDSELDEGVFFHARLKAEDAVEAQKDTVDDVNLDRLNLEFVNGTTSFMVGRQALFLGQGALADTNNTAIRGAFKDEKFTLAAMAGKFDVDNKLLTTAGVKKDYMAVDASGKLNDKLQLTAAYLAGEESLNYKATAFGFKATMNPKLAVGGEFISNSEADTDDSGFWANVYLGTLAEKGDTQVTLTYQDFDENAITPLTTCEEAAAKGYVVNISHRIAPNTDFTVIYADLEKTDAKANDLTRTYLQLTTKF